MFVYFSEDMVKCWYNPMFITFNIIFCFGFSVFSIYPRVRKALATLSCVSQRKLQSANPRVGLLQSAVVTGYCTFLIWSALSRYDS